MERSPQFPSMGLMSDGLARRPGEYSPRSSPRGNRSPVVSRPDTTGTLKTTISLRSTPAIVHSSHTGPFYLLKDNVKVEQTLSGSTNMMLHYNLEHTFNKFIGRKVKDKLSAFLPSLPGNIDMPASVDGTSDSSLRKVIQQPPLGGKDLIPLSGAQLAGFRLHPGPLPEQYRTANLQALKKKKHRKHKSETIIGGVPAVGGGSTSAIITSAEGTLGAEGEKKHRKTKKHDEERKKKKKDKKKKKRHSPEPTQGIAPPMTALTPSTPLINNRITP